MINRRHAAVCVLALGALALGAPAAPAGTGGTGGTSTPGMPRVSAVACLSSAMPVCRGRRAVVRGEEFVVRGSNLGRVRKMVFNGGRSRRDDFVAPVTRSSRRYAVATVPRRARSGAVVLLGPRRSRLARVARVTVRRPPKVTPLDIAPGSAYFYAGRRRATFAFTVQKAGTAQVLLVNEDTQAVVTGWDVPAQPGRPGQVRWDGRGPNGIEPQGRYAFRLVGAARISAAPAPGSTTSFFFADHLFPIRGAHNLGYSLTNSFGGGGTRTHKGQDMFARCGTRLAAARGGRVQYAGYHSAAGNYVVVDGAETEIDYVYMHLRRPPPVRTGERVFTGQKIGEVGETGRASGCHLHFELWSAPGWYQGGRAFDPLPALKIWDSYS